MDLDKEFGGTGFAKNQGTFFYGTFFRLKNYSCLLLMQPVLPEWNSIIGQFLNHPYGITITCYRKCVEMKRGTDFGGIMNNFINSMNVSKKPSRKSLPEILSIMTGANDNDGS